MNAIELENKLKKFGYNLSNRAIANIIGITEQYYSNKKKNGTDFKQADIEKIENKFNISLMCDVVVTANNNLVNILPVAASCGNGLTIDTSLIYNYDENAKYIYAVASGSSMEPVICSGDVILAKKFDGNFTDGIYLFNIGDDFFIKTLAKNVNQIECISANPQYDKIVLRGQELDKLVILGSVVGIVRRF